MKCVCGDSYWMEITNKQGVFKVKVCPECGAFLNEVVAHIQPQINDVKDPHQKYFDGMFKCFDKVTERYPLMAEDNREAMAVSLFIQIAKS